MRWEHNFGIKHNILLISHNISVSSVISQFGRKLSQQISQFRNISLHIYTHFFICCSLTPYHLLISQIQSRNIFAARRARSPQYLYRLLLTNNIELLIVIIAMIIILCAYVHYYRCTTCPLLHDSSVLAIQHLSNNMAENCF